MPRAETITSAANPLLKDVRRAVARGCLTQDGCAVAETFHLLEEALRSGCEIPAVLASKSAVADVERLGVARAIVLPDALLRTLSGTESAQGVIALVRPRAWRLEDIFGARPLVMALDGVQDPGNAGTIVRAAEALGATGVLFLKGSVSPHNPKTLRASAGSLFRLPHVSGIEADEARRTLERRGLMVYAALATGGTAAADANLAAPCAVIVGSEARGVSAEWLAGARAISIPTVGVESLNAGLAAGILLYEARRQRRARP